MPKFAKICLSALIITVLTSICATAGSVKQPVFGWLEKIKIIPQKILLTAKLDSGAQSSSIYATHIKYFTKNDRKWVKFTLPGDDKRQTVTIERPVKRMVKIKLKLETKDGLTYTERPVIEMMICLNHQHQNININLADRGRFLYPVLLGRTSLKRFHALIDVSKTFTIKPTC